MSEDAYDTDLLALRRDDFFAISGCSGSGKSSILGELETRSYRVFHEPGRQIVKEQMSIGGEATPWQNAEKFLELVLSRAMHHMISAATQDSISFFDRGIVDAVNYFYQHKPPPPPHIERAASTYRYNRRVFMSPPWREIYRNDEERRHSFDDGVSEYEALLKTYAKLGYEIVVIPKLPTPERADFIIENLK